jgi:hypothetical protein
LRRFDAKIIRMTVLDSFLQFAKELPAGALHDVEDALAEIMASYSGDFEFTAEERAELGGRLAETDPDFATDAEVQAFFGKTF